MSKIKYNEEYLKYGFVSVQHRGECLPQCVICIKTLSNSAMKPSLLKRHLESNHSDKKNRGKSYFERLGENVKRQRLDHTGQSYQKSIGILYSSYEVSLLIAKNMKAHTIAENLVLPAARILVRNLIGEKEVGKLNSVSLSNDTVRRRIHDMSDDIFDQVTTAIKATKYGFAMQLDEPIDVSNCSQLLVYVRFTENDIVKTELLMSNEVPGTTKGKDIYNIVDEFFQKNGLEWSKLVGCTTDGAPPMLGRKSGFQSYVKAVSPGIIFTHCFIHRFALCAKVLPPELLSCLQQIVKIVNFVKMSALNIRLFARLCADLGSDHTCLLFHTEVRWLSRGNMTRRVFELRNELLEFYEKRNHNFKNDFANTEFFSRLAYLSDIFDTLNQINMFFEGPNSTIADFVSKLQAYLRKLDL